MLARRSVANKTFIGQHWQNMTSEVDWLRCETSQASWKTDHCQRCEASSCQAVFHLVLLFSADVIVMHKSHLKHGGGVSFTNRGLTCEEHPRRGVPILAQVAASSVQRT